MSHEDYHRLVQSDQVPPSVIGSHDGFQIVMTTGFLANAPVEALHPSKRTSKLFNQVPKCLLLDPHQLVPIVTQ